MKLETLILYSIISVVLIGLPVIISKKFGKNPMELLFGKRVNRTIFGKKTETEDANASPKGKKQTNSNRNDLLNLVSRLATYARRNHFQLLVPGTLSSNGTIAVLTAILITRSRVVGINCFGFGGDINARARTKDWMQLMNGEQKPFPSPVQKNLDQEKIVRQVLEETGWPGVDVEIIGVFTSPSVRLYNVADTNCYTRDDALDYLQSERFLSDRGLDPQKIEQALAPRIVHTKDVIEKQEQKEEQASA
jgi:hypothetical protein